MKRSVSLLALAVVAGLLGCGGRQGSPATIEAEDAASEAASACGAGNWVLQTSGGLCPCCALTPDSVELQIPGSIAAEGGTATDSELNAWQFDPGTCSATLNGSYDASDTIDFASGQAACQAVCDTCAPCSIPCAIHPFP